MDYPDSDQIKVITYLSPIGEDLCYTGSACQAETISNRGQITVAAYISKNCDLTPDSASAASQGA